MSVTQVVPSVFPPILKMTVGLRQVLWATDLGFRLHLTFYDSQKCGAQFNFHLRVSEINMAIVEARVDNCVFSKSPLREPPQVE